MRILLVKTSSLGDVIHNLPVVSDIVRALPGAQVDWCVEEAFAAIPSLHPGVGRVIPVAIRRWRKKLLAARTLRELRVFRDALRSQRYDAIIDTQGLLKSALITRLALGKRLGYAADSAREPLSAHFYGRRISIDRSAHAVLRNRRLAAQALGYGIDPEAIDYGIAPPPLSAPWVPAMPYVVGLTATSRDDKLWPDTHWIDLTKVLRARGLAVILPAGSAAERQRAELIAASSTGSTVAGEVPALVAPALDIKSLAGLLRGARATIGVDTGLSHLSAAVGTPTIALYTATEPGLTGVVGPGFCLNLGACRQIPSVSAVVAGLDRIGHAGHFGMVAER